MIEFSTCRGKAQGRRIKEEDVINVLKNPESRFIDVKTGNVVIGKKGSTSS